MDKTSVMAIGVVIALALGCGLADEQDPDRATSGTQEATEEASEDAAQAEPQAQPSETPSTQPRKPGWQDLAQVAGEEAGGARGLAYERVFALGYKVWEAGQAGSTDAVLTVAQAEQLDAGLVEDAMATYGENRTAMAEYLRSGARPLRQGVTGKVDVKAIEPDQLGPFTVRAVVTVYGCPGKADLPFLAQAAATTMAGNLPVVASGFTAVLEYKGTSCQTGRFGEATFNAKTNKLSLK